MKVLHITNKPIYPIVDGGCMAMNALLKSLLNLGFEVKNVCLSTEKHPFNREAYPEKLQQICRPETVKIDTTVRAKSAFFSLFHSDSYNVSRFYDAQFAALIENELKHTNTGLVILESLYVLPYLSIIRKNFNGKIILRAHNVEHLLWERLASNETQFLKRLFFKKLAADLKKYEIQQLQKVDGIATVSEADKNYFAEKGIQTPMQWIPVSLDFKKYHDFSLAKDQFFFLGAMNWKPNQEAVERLTKSIFPAISKINPSAQLHLAGSFMEEFDLPEKLDNTTIHGLVSDVGDFMRAHGILIVPLISGSGIRIKILESMSLGIPVISSSIGFEGIPVQHNVHAFIADTDEAFIEIAQKLMETPELAHQIGQAGKNLVEQTYNSTVISKQILGFIEHI